MILKILAAALALTISTSAMARKHHGGQRLPGYGYTVSDKDFPVWDYAAYRYYHPKCRCCPRS